MKDFVKSTIVVISLLGLVGCSGNGDPISGHKVGINRSGQVLDLGDIRVELADMHSARNFPIPETRFFSFSWSPLGYHKQFDRLDYREPTQADWRRYAQLTLSNRDWSRYGDPDQARQDFIEYIQRQEARSANSPFPARVRPDGRISKDLCNGTVAGRDVCSGQLVMSQAQKRAVAQAALDHFEPSCTLGVIDPPEVVGLYPNYSSGLLNMVVQVVCP